MVAEQNCISIFICRLRSSAVSVSIAECSHQKGSFLQQLEGLPTIQYFSMQNKSDQKLDSNCRHVYTLMYLGSDHVNLCIVTNTSTTGCDFMFTPGLFLDMFLYF